MKRLLLTLLLVLPATCFAFSLPFNLPSAASNAYIVGSVGNPSGNVAGNSGTVPAWSGALGYRLSPALALEAGYGSIGRVEFPNGVQANGRGYGVAALYTFAPHLGISPFVKVGFNRIMNDMNGVKSQVWTPSYGIGVSYPLTASTSVRATFERFRKEGRNALSVGIAYGF